MMPIRILLLSAVAAISAAGAAQAATGADQRVLMAAKAAYAGQVSLLEQIVNIDSGTGNVEGGKQIQEILAQRLAAIGAKVELKPAEAPGLPPNLVATLTGKGKGRVLLIGHIDTVFEPGEAKKRPFRVEGPLGHGPGVMDEKGGVVTGVTALELIQKLKFRDFSKITLLLETSE